MDKAYATHEFPAFFDASSRILILGSFPSVKSREEGFYYGHKQNRFWKMLSGCYEEDTPSSIEEKKEFCLAHHIALYDSIESCLIEGSSDASIKEVVPANLDAILRASKIERVIFNGKSAKKWFAAFQQENEGIAYYLAPSTSAANASFNLERLIEVWKPFLIF